MVLLIRASGVIGSRTTLRTWRRKTWRFESSLAHKNKEPSTNVLGSLFYEAKEGVCTPSVEGSKVVEYMNERKRREYETRTAPVRREFSRPQHITESSPQHYKTATMFATVLYIPPVSKAFGRSVRKQ